MKLHIPLFRRVTVAVVDVVVYPKAVIELVQSFDDLIRGDQMFLTVEIQK